MKQKFNIKAPNDLSICDYLRLMELIKSGKTDFKTNIRCIAICLGITYEEVLKMKPDDVNEYSSQLQGKMNKRNFFKNIHLSCPKKINLNGQDYKINYDLDKINMAQYVDFQMYVAENIDIENINKILSVFVIPKGKEYNEGYDVEDLQDTIYNYMPVGIASEICFFLKKQLLSSIKIKLWSLVMVMKLMKWKTKDKEVKKQLQEAVIQMRNLKKQIQELYSTIG